MPVEIISYPIIEYSWNKGDAIRGLALIEDNKQSPTSYTKIHQDLNEDAGGPYRYLCYSHSTGTNRITSITFIARGHSLHADKYNGYFVFKHDINDGTGGSFVYLLYITDNDKPLGNKL